MRPSVLILNGPNLNMLGVREPEIYGSQTLADIEAMCGEEAERLGLEIDFRQSNHEGELVSAIQSARGVHDAIIINAAAYTHTSVAILDALMTAETLVIEVHLSNPYKREPFRHRSFVAPAAKGMICGLGAQGYLLALAAVARLVNGENE
jgi:3-dehydroquinate dehydratase II